MKPKSTNDGSLKNANKSLLIAHHGFGKTTQFKYYQEHYGPGFIISGESGLKSIEDAGIDYLDFTSWDGESDPKNGVYSFLDIYRWVRSKDFSNRGYKWLGLDSLTELSDRLIAHIEVEHADEDNGFAVWNEYNRQMIGVLKRVRDMPMHVCVTCLAAEEEDDNGKMNYWPMVKGNKVAKQIPGLFDHVFCGVRSTSGDMNATRVNRLIITDEVRGWRGKVRDPKNRLRPVEPTGDITELFKLMSMSNEEFAKIELKRATKGKKTGESK